MSASKIDQVGDTLAYVKARDSDEPPCLTIELSAPAGGKEWQMHSKRLRAALDEVAKSESLREGFDAERLRAVVEKADPLLDDLSVWSGDYEGIVLHASSAGARLFKLSYPASEYVEVGPRLLFKNVARQLDSTYDGLALDLSLKEPKLYRIVGEKIKGLAANALPESIYALSEQEIYDPGERAHMRRTSGVGQEGGHMVNQGAGSKDNTRDLNMHAFMREVAHAIDGLEGSHELPLAVFGDEKVASEFAEFFKGQEEKLIFISDAKSDLSESDVVERCAAEALKADGRRRAEIVELLQSSDPTSEKWTDSLKDIYEAAIQGRIDTCAVAADQRKWCHYHEESAKLESIEGDQPEDRQRIEALDRILVNTLNADGTCIAIESSEMDGKPAMALLRW